MRKDGLDMVGVQFGKEIVEQEDCFLFGRLFDEFDEDEFESDEDGFVLASGEVGVGRVFGTTPSFAFSKCHPFFFRRGIFRHSPSVSMRYLR